MWLRRSHIYGAVATAAVLGSAALATGDELPIVDSHLHYSQNSWQDQAPAAILLLMDQAGVSRAFVSSTPDEGTVRLFEMAPDRIVPVLRPYRQPGELSSWHQDPTVVPYLEQRLARPIYRGIGEFHLSGSDAASPWCGKSQSWRADTGSSSTVTATRRRRRSWWDWCPGCASCGPTPG